VFLIDLGDGVGDQLVAIRNEVKRAVRDLQPTQSFNIVTAAAGKTFSMDMQLLAATESNKARAEEFLDKLRAWNLRDDIVGGMQIAAIMKPEVVWLVSGGIQGQHEDRVVADAVSVATGRFRINTTVQFASSVAPYWLMADRTGGVCLDEKGAILPKPDSVKAKQPTPDTQPKTLREPC
jgi:hypothetical protein